MSNDPCEGCSGDCRECGTNVPRDADFDLLNEIQDNDAREMEELALSEQAEAAADDGLP